MYRRGMEVDDLIEAFYQGYIRCCIKLNRQAEGISAYRCLQQALAATVRTPPSRETQLLFQGLFRAE